MITTNEVITTNLIEVKAKINNNELLQYKQTSTRSDA